MIDFIGLELIEFHDVPLKSISIKNDESPNLELEIMLWEEDKNDFIHKTLVFGGLSHINPENISNEENSELEIYSFHYHLENNLLYGKLICLTGFGKPSLEIDFSCQTVAINETITKHNRVDGPATVR